MARHCHRVATSAWVVRVAMAACGATIASLAIAQGVVSDSYGAPSDESTYGVPRRPIVSYSHRSLDNVVPQSILDPPPSPAEAYESRSLFRESIYEGAPAPQGSGPAVGEYEPFQQTISSNARYATGTRRFDDYNFEIELPGKPWVNVPIDPAHPENRLMLMREGQPVFVLVLSHPIGVELQLDTRALTVMAQSVVRGKAPDARFTESVPSTASGMDGVYYETDLTANRLNIHFATWLTIHNGFTYQIVAYGPPEHTSAIDAANRELRERIRIVDASRIAHNNEIHCVGNHDSRQFGYRVDLTNRGWIKIESLEQLFPTADMGAERQDVGLVVAAVPMPGRKPDIETLTKVMLERQNIKYPGTQIVRTLPCRHGPLQGQEVHIRLAAKRANATFRARMVADERCAYMIAAWSIGEPSNDPRVTEILDLVDIYSRDLPPTFELTEHQRQELGATLNEMGVESYRRGDYVAAIDYLKSALEFCPSHEAALDNYVGVVSQLDRKDEAIRILEQHLPQFPNSLALRATHAKLLAERGDAERARQAYADVFAKGYTDETALDHYLSLVKEAEAYDEAIAVVGSIAQRKPTVFVQTMLASLYRSKGDPKQAIVMLKVLHQWHPTNAIVTLELACSYEAAEEYDAALALTQALVDDGNQDEVVLLVHGRNQLNAKRLSEAKKTFERAAEIYPNSTATRDMLQIASNLLGQGDNSLLKTPIAPVPIPPIVSAALHKAASQPAAKLDKFGAEELIRLTGVFYKPDKPLKTTVFRRIKVHTQGGVTQYNNLTFDFEPAVERFYVNRVAVLDANGKLVAEGTVDQYYVMDESSSGMATSTKTVNVPVPGLKPGYYLECMVTREEKFAAESFPFQEAILSTSVPVGISSFYVAGDVKQLRHAASMPVDTSVDGEVLHCSSVNPQPLRVEARQPAYDKLVPVVWIGDAAATWEREVAEYQEMIAPRLAVDDDTRKLAAELTADCATKREKLAVLAAHVQQACTYQALEFGRRALLPNPASQTVRLKYGDCKDHSVLLHGLLAAVGIESHLALVNTSGVLAANTPSLEQFDHMILYVPSAAAELPVNAMGGVIVDATNKSADPLAVPSSGMCEKVVLVLDPKQPRFVRVPPYGIDAGQMTCRRWIEIRSNPAQPSLVETTVKEQVTLNPNLSAGLRYVLQMFEPGERRDIVQQLVAPGSQVRLKQLAVENLEAPSAPLVLHLEYMAPNAFHRLATGSEGKTLVGQPPAPLETYFLEADYAEDRETPYVVRMPMLVQSSVQIRLPPGHQLIDVERWTTSGQNRFAAWASQARQEGSTVQIEHSVRSTAGTFPAADYTAYYGSMKESLALLQSPVTVRERVVEIADRDAIIRR